MCLSRRTPSTAMSRRTRFEDPADRRCADPVADLEQLALDPLVSQPLFSVASRSMSAAISALTGGRPVRFG
jgi:hypothetical protein